MSVAPPAVPRRLLHLRRITCEAFEREDGLLDIEGLLIDTKPTPVQLVTGRSIEPGSAIHRRVSASAPTGQRKPRSLPLSATWSKILHHPVPTKKGTDDAGLS